MNEFSSIDIGLFLVAIVALGLSVYNTIKQQYIRGAEISLLKDDIESTFELIGAPSIIYEGGYLRTDLIFYNSGDRMSILKIKLIYNDKLNLKSDPLAIRESIPPHEHKMISIKGNKLNYFGSKINDEAPIKIDSLTIEYYWTKKGKIRSVTEQFPLQCVIKRI